MLQKYYTIIKERGREVNNMKISKTIVCFFIIFNLVVIHIWRMPPFCWWVIEIIIIMIISFLTVDK